MLAPTRSLQRDTPISGRCSKGGGGGGDGGGEEVREVMLRGGNEGKRVGRRDERQ